MMLEGVKVCERHITEQGYELTYLLSEEVFDGRPAFSVCVSILDSTSGEREERTVRDITSEKNEALRIFGLVCDGTVTPMTLVDVITDLIA